MTRKTKRSSVKITGWTVIGLVVLLFLGTACDEPTDNQPSMEQISVQTELQGEEWLVSRVVDGDTIEVTRGGDKEKVRLIGLNTPETVDPRRPVECFGKEASNYAKRLLEGAHVTLLPDDTQDDRDKYGRLLRYVVMDNGTIVNLLMIERGYGYEYTYKVPYKYQTEFKLAEQNAQKDKRGLWSPDACGEAMIE